MKDPSHIIDIDSIVLTHLDQRPLVRAALMIQSQVERELSQAGFSSSTERDGRASRVAGEVARAVMQSIDGGNAGE